MSVSTIVLNQILVKYGNAPVAAIGIVFKANMFITFLQMGLANGVQPLMGYNFGAGNQKRFYGSGLFYEKMLSGRWNPGDGIIFLFSRTNYPPVHQR